MGQNASVVLEQAIRDDTNNKYTEVKGNYMFSSDEALGNFKIKWCNQECNHSLHAVQVKPQVSKELNSEESQDSSHSSEGVTIIEETSLESETPEIIIDDSSCQSLQAVSEPDEQVTTCGFLKSRITGSNPVQDINFKGSFGVSTTKGNAIARRQGSQQQKKLENRYRCLTCDKLFTSKISFVQHANNEANQNCNTTASGFVALKAREKASITSSRDNNNNNLKSKACSTARNVRQFRSRKQITQGASNKKLFWCHVCKRPFTNFFIYQKHRQEHLPATPKTCQYCDKSFSWPSQLKRHITTHTGEKPHICAICNKSYRLLASLKRHAKKCAAK